MEIRTDQNGGKLLFCWDPERNVVSIVNRNTLYDVELRKEQNGGTYQIVSQCDKHTEGTVYNKTFNSTIA